MKTELRTVGNDTELVVSIPQGTKIDVNALLLVLLPRILEALLEYFRGTPTDNTTEL